MKNQHLETLSNIALQDEAKAKAAFEKVMIQLDNIAMIDRDYAVQLRDLFAKKLQGKF